MSVRAPELSEGEWLRGEPLSLAQLRGRVVLLDFFTFGCINCMNNLPMLQRLQHRYAQALQVIGVHSGKFAYEKNADAVCAAIERLRIDYPVINDPGTLLAECYAIKAWPTMVLIDSKGSIVATFRGEAQGVAIDLALQKLGIAPSQEQGSAQTATGPLHFPEAVVYGEKRVYVANGTDVREYAMDGILLRRFTPFRHAAALAWEAQRLYVADRGSGTITSIDLHSETRTVLLEGLRSPAAIAVDETTLSVAEAGAHCISMFDKNSSERLRRFGNRFEALRDGEGEGAQLAQPMGLARCDDGLLWFVDAESSSLRFIEGSTVSTAVGEGLFTFGDSDTAPLLLQHPQGIVCGRFGDGCGGGRLFISDTYNGKLKVYDPQSGRMSTLLEGLNEPTGLSKHGCNVYIAETGAHRVVKFDLSALRTMTFAV